MGILMDFEHKEPQILQDRIGEYLLPHADQFIFDELSDS